MVLLIVVILDLGLVDVNVVHVLSADDLGKTVLQSLLLEDAGRGARGQNEGAGVAGGVGPEGVLMLVLAIVEDEVPLEGLGEQARPLGVDLGQVLERVAFR